MPDPPPGVHSDEQNYSDPIVRGPSPALPELCAHVHARVESFLAEEAATERLRAVQEQSRRSLRVIEKALENYSLDELSLSYNGGKDCLVLLILYLSALHTHPTKRQPTNNSTTHGQPSLQQIPSTLRSVYIISPHPFHAIDAFVNDSVKTYHLSLSRYAKPMREAFADYLLDSPSVRAIFVGTRRTDPHGASLTHFDPTDRGWPSFMRIHPVIDWHYAEIWAFIRHLGIPYCVLYDLGYTSLGGRTDTHPNPALREDDGGGGDGGGGGGGGDAGKEGKFRPAYELVEDEAERLGRDR